MPDLEISLACCDYDRTRALFDGRVKVEGCRLLAVPIEPEEAFHRAFRFEEFDISELSLSSHTLMTARGENAYVGVPAFVSRLFRHSGIYIRTDRGISQPEDLRGRTIGVPEYQITANVWIRGILQDEFGLDPSTIHWRRGGLEEPGREERASLTLPPGIDLVQVGAGKTLSAMLEAGEIDAVIGARAPSCFLNGAANVGRLFPDYPDAERRYYAKHKIFPIMHIIGVRKALAERHPWLPVSIYKAFSAARDLAMAELGQIGHLFVSLPWVVANFEQAKSSLGDDYWSYGFANNRHVLDVFMRYHHAQGLSKALVRSEQLFASSTLDLSKI